MNLSKIFLSGALCLSLSSCDSDLLNAALTGVAAGLSASSGIPLPSMALPKAADVKRYTFPAYLKASNYRGETPMDWYSPWTASRDCIDVYFPQIPYRLSSSEALEYVRQPEVSNICPHKIIIEMCFVINRKCVDGDSIGIDPGTEEMPSKETGKGYSGPGDLEWASCMALEEDFEIGDFMGAVTDDDKHKIWNGEQFWACHYVMKAKYAYPR